MSCLLSQEEVQLLAFEFKLFDKAGRNELNRDQVAKLFKYLNPKIAEWEIDRLVSIFDVNQDGLFQLDEFISVSLIDSPIWYIIAH